MAVDCDGFLSKGPCTLILEEILLLEEYMEDPLKTSFSLPAPLKGLEILSEILVHRYFF